MNYYLTAYRESGHAQPYVALYKEPFASVEDALVYVEENLIQPATSDAELREIRYDAVVSDGKLVRLSLSIKRDPPRRYNNPQLFRILVDGLNEIYIDREDYMDNHSVVIALESGMPPLTPADL